MLYYACTRRVPPYRYSSSQYSAVHVQVVQVSHRTPADAINHRTCRGRHSPAHPTSSPCRLQTQAAHRRPPHARGPANSSMARTEICHPERTSRKVQTGRRLKARARRAVLEWRLHAPAFCAPLDPHAHPDHAPAHPAPPPCAAAASHTAGI